MQWDCPLINGLFFFVNIFSLPFYSTSSGTLLEIDDLTTWRRNG